MIILGIDPSLSSTGWAVVQSISSDLNYIASGVIKTTITQQMYLRITRIVNIVESIIDRYQPSIIAMEESFINTNAVSSLKLGYVRGSIMALAGKYELIFKEFKPTTIKKTVVGSGKAEKHQVLHMLTSLIQNMPDIAKLDESDAIAICYTCYANSCETY